MNCSYIPISDTVQIDEDWSPTTDQFFYSSAYDKCYTDPYTTHPSISFESPADLVQEYQVVSGSTVPKASLQSYRPSYDSATFEQLEQFATDIPFSPSRVDCFDTETICISPHSISSDEAHPRSSSSPEHSPLLCKEESPVKADQEPTPKIQPRRRGRPRLDCGSSNSTSNSYGSSKCQRTSRVPHNQVERKYRQGLNTELERLRRTVPTLLQCSGERVVGQPQLSKAMVLVGAIEHIKTVERERDALIVENERLRGLTVV
jgi:hypothetical protein